MRFDTVVFDLDGTLVDSYDALTTALNRAAGEHSLREHTIDQVRALVGEGIERLLERAFGECNARLLASFDSHYESCLAGETRLLGDVVETLTALRERGVRMAVCTNKPTRFSRSILELLGISPFFSAVAGPDLAQARKPDPTHLLFTIAASGGSPASALMVGDMPIDAAAARGAACPVALVATGSSTREELLAVHPDFFLERLTDLVGIVAAGDPS